MTPDFRSRSGDGGSASLWLLGFLMVVWMVAMVALAQGEAMVARHRVAAAADLAALAAAGVLARASVHEAGPNLGGTRGEQGAVWIGGPADGVGASTIAAACAAATRVAAANGGEVTGCHVVASTVQVSAEIACAGLAKLLRPGSRAFATARAGPA